LTGQRLKQLRWTESVQTEAVSDSSDVHRDLPSGLVGAPDGGNLVFESECAGSLHDGAVVFDGLLNGLYPRPEHSGIVVQRPLWGWTEVGIQEVLRLQTLEHLYVSHTLL
jgi:hypothetical protein